jgi:hypothetical protein
MKALPWLLEHGAVVWQIALFAFVIAGSMIGPLRARLAARRAAKAARAFLGKPIDPRAARRGERVTIEGRVEVVEEPCARFEDGAPAAIASAGFEDKRMATDARARRVAIRVDDALVDLEGPIVLLGGAREDRPGRPLSSLPRAIQDRAELPAGSAPGGRGPVFQSFGLGDRVVVAGCLREEASDDAATYRAAAKRWTLTPDPQEAGILAAPARAPIVTGPAGLVRMAQAFTALAVGVGALAVAGEVAIIHGVAQLAVYASRPEAPLDEAFRAATPAALTPFRRRAVLDQLARTLDERRDPDPRALAARAALAELRGQRGEAAEMWIAHGEPERGARLAAEVRRDVLAARGYYLAGDFERAADAWHRAGDSFPLVGTVAELRFGVGVNLLARRLDRAAYAAKKLAHALRAHPADNERLRRFYESRGEIAECLADALDARRGDGEGWKNLHRRREGAEHPGCALLRLDLFDGAERVKAIAALPELSQNAWDVPNAWIELLAAEADPSVHGAGDLAADDDVYDVLVPNGGTTARMLPAVERGIADALEKRAVERKSKEQRWRARTSRAAGLFALLSGDTGAAKRLADLHDADMRAITHRADRCGDFHEDNGEALREIVAIAAGNPPKSDAPGNAWQLRNFTKKRDPAAILSLLTQRAPPDEEEKRAWSLAAQGDGVGLSRWLRRTVAQPGTFLRFGAPLLEEGRDDVARWVHWGHRPPTAIFRPTDEVVHLANLAAAAAELGDREAADDLSARAARFREAILRRETAVPLAVLERL